MAPYILMHAWHAQDDAKPMRVRRACGGWCVGGALPTIQRLKELGLSDENIILDPGFGFSKTTEQNYELMADSR